MEYGKDSDTPGPNIAFFGLGVGEVEDTGADWSMPRGYRFGLNGIGGLGDGPWIEAGGAKY